MTNPPLLEQIKGSLIALLGEMNRADTTAMVASLERLDALVAQRQARTELDPRLLHFLERRSYAKALEWLGGSAEIPAGTCAPKQ